VEGRGGYKYVGMGSIEPPTVTAEKYHPLYRDMLSRTAKLGIPLYHELVREDP
jgi:hypothetical protein